jgi:very-short-patch-repair endonuclease
MGDKRVVVTNRTSAVRRGCGSRRSHSDHHEPHLVEILGVRSAVTVFGTRDERIVAIAELQRGIVTRVQLSAAGIGNAATGRLIRAGRLVRVHPGVYAVRPAIEVPLARETAALLACGPNAFLSHSSAARLWKLCDAVNGPVELTISNRRNRHLPGARVHRARRLLPRDVSFEQGLPVTSPARTLLDRAAALRMKDFERELDEALSVLRIVGRGELLDVATRATGHRGAPVCKRLLERRSRETVTQSEAERLFLALIREAHLPEPETQVSIAGYKVDFLWRKQRVVFEIDGYSFHTSRRSFDRDRAEGMALKQAGYDPNRVSRDQVVYEPIAVAAHVASALARATR